MPKHQEDGSSPTKKLKRFLALPEFIDHQELKQQIISNQIANQDYLIIDVRDEEERSGNGWIPGSLNIPSTQFDANVGPIRDQIHKIPTLYFHCALSQVRGPKCAQKYVAKINQSEDHKLEQQVFILRGGFENWKGVYGLDKSLCENVSFVDTSLK